MKTDSFDEQVRTQSLDDPKMFLRSQPQVSVRMLEYRPRGIKVHIPWYERSGL